MLAAFTLSALLTQPSPVVLTVAPNGNDTWSGALAAPNSARTDGPLATLEAARDRLRKLPRTTPATVQLRAGIYRRSTPFVLGPADSGTPDSPRVYCNYPGEKPILSGLRVLTGWKEGANRVWTAPVPGVWTFSQLFVNGSRRYRPRWPENGTFLIADTTEPSAAVKGKGYDQFKFSQSDLQPEWAGRADYELVVFLSWSIVRSRIAAVDPDEKVVRMATPTPTADSWGALPKGNRYFIDNATDKVSKPGQWALLESPRQVRYVPRPGENINSTLIEAPEAPHLLRLDGNASPESWVEHIHFKGITFEGTNWNLPPGGRNFYQAEADLSGAIRLQGARHIRIQECTVQKTGEYAVDIGKACQNVLIERCRLYDLGAGGVKIGEMRLEEDPAKLTQRCEVRETEIVGGGRIHPAAVGIWVGQNPYNVLDGNWIEDFYYTGISVGWSWGYGKSGSHHNTLSNNRISQIGQRVLSDMGGIYTLSPSPGTILTGNVIHDVNSWSYGGWGIYPDEGSTDILIENNLVFRTKSAGFHQHYGKNNIIRNNVFAYGVEAQIMRTRAEDHLSLTFERNIVLFRERPLLGSNWTGNNYLFHSNLYWDESGRPFDFFGMPWKAWREKGQDVGSLIADPRFRDPANGDFRLESGSPAHQIGFQPFAQLDPSWRKRELPKFEPAFPIPEP